MILIIVVIIIGSSKACPGDQLARVSHLGWMAINGQPASVAAPFLKDQSPVAKSESPS